jgi:hypothetical protein
MNPRLAAAVTMLLALVGGFALWEREIKAHASPAAEVARAAQAFLAALPPDLQQLAIRPLADAERTAWHFVPGRYPGIELGALDGPQTAAAHRLLGALLSSRGHEKVTAIVRLEDVLRRLETAQGRDASHRDPARYSLIVFGTPAADGTFAVRFQGHHVSLHIAVHDGQLAGHSPRFLGSNPHEVASQGAGRVRVLSAEEDLARALLLLLDEAQLQQAWIAKEAPADILLGPGVAPSALGARRGVPWRALTDVQRGVLWRLLEEHAQVLRPEWAEAELARIGAQGLDELSFAWAGGRERGQGHYYRIHGVHFAIEYDCTQNDANHVHVVWRDFERDFGGDPLQRHIETQHGKR